MSNSLREAAAAAAGSQAYPAGALYLVATPIGNLADLTLRSIHVLGLVDAVACEDTRHSAPLLRHLGIDKPLLAVLRAERRDPVVPHEDAVGVRAQRVRPGGEQLIQGRDVVGHERGLVGAERLQQPLRR